MTHETESALRARILELENGNAYLHDVMERAESEAAAQIAELRAVNSEQADKIVDLQTRRDEHLRTIADLMGEKAELTTALNSALNIIRANGLHTEAHAKFFVAATDVVEKHSAK